MSEDQKAEKKAGPANNNRRDVENKAKDEISALGKLAKSNEGHSQSIERWSQLRIKSQRPGGLGSHHHRCRSVF